MNGSRMIAAAALFLLPVPAAMAQVAQPGRNAITVRGNAQDVYFYAAAGSASPPRRKILFAPGDGGWRGFAITIAETLSSWGYDVYGLDTRKYLMSLTGRPASKESEVAADMRQIAGWMSPGDTERVLLLGWSEGAGLMVLAAAAGENKPKFEGVITLGLGNFNVLAWRLVDDLTYITKKQPREPAFFALDYMPKIAPLPVWMIQSSADEYVPREETRKLFEAAREPKRLTMVDAKNHRFEGNREGFFRTLREGLEWIQQTRP